MGFRACSVLSLFIIFSLISSRAWSEDSGSVFLIDGTGHQFLRATSPNHGVESPSLSLQEIGAAVSILLGFAPSSSLSATGSSKLDEILVPNPFNRPRVVLLLEVNGIQDHKQIAQHNELFSTAFRGTYILGSDKVDIHFPDEDDVSVLLLDELAEDFTEKEISSFASMMGGSYAPNAHEPLNGVLTIPLANGAIVNLHMSKKSEREYIVNLLSLIRNVERAMQLHDSSQSAWNPAELLMGCFSGIKALQEQNGAASIVHDGVELLLLTLTKILASLQEAYKGQIVGVIYSHSRTTQDLGKTLDVVFTSHHAARLLVEDKASLAEVVLVRRTLAWVTGLILLISTLIGICYLLNMPLTRDTLLYSNVKLD